MCLYIHHPSIGSKSHEQNVAHFFMTVWQPIETSLILMADHGCISGAAPRHWGFASTHGSLWAVGRGLRCELLGFWFQVNIYWSLKWWLPISGIRSESLGLHFPMEKHFRFFSLERLYHLIFNHNKVFWRPCRHKISKTYIRGVVLSEWITNHLHFPIVFYERSINCPVLARESISCAITGSIPYESTKHSPRRTSPGESEDRAGATAHHWIHESQGALSGSETMWGPMWRNVKNGHVAARWTV